MISGSDCSSKCYSKLNIHVTGHPHSSIMLTGFYTPFGSYNGRIVYKKENEGGRVDPIGIKKPGARIALEDRDEPAYFWFRENAWVFFSNGIYHANQVQIDNNNCQYMHGKLKNYLIYKRVFDFKNIILLIISWFQRNNLLMISVLLLSTAPKVSQLLDRKHRVCFQNYKQ